MFSLIPFDKLFIQLNNYIIVYIIIVCSKYIIVLQQMHMLI